MPNRNIDNVKSGIQNGQYIHTVTGTGTQMRVQTRKLKVEQNLSSSHHRSLNREPVAIEGHLFIYCGGWVESRAPLGGQPCACANHQALCFWSR